MKKKGAKKTDWEALATNQEINVTSISIGSSFLHVKNIFEFTIPASQSSSKIKIIDLSWLKEKLGRTLATQFVNLIRSAIEKRGWNPNTIQSVFSQDIKLLHNYFVDVELRNIFEIDYEWISFFHVWLNDKYNGTSTCTKYALFLRSLLISMPIKYNKKFPDIDIRNNNFPPTYYNWNQNPQKTIPYSKNEFTAITKCLQLDLEHINNLGLEKPQFRFVVYMLLIMVQTGRELTSILELSENCLQQSNTNGVWILSFYKGRGHQEKEQAIVTTDEEKIEQPIKGWIINVIKKLINETSNLRALLPDNHKLKHHLLILPDKSLIAIPLTSHDFDAGRRAFQLRHGFYPSSSSKKSKNGELIPSVGWSNQHKLLKEKYQIDKWFSIDTQRIRKSISHNYEAREKKTHKPGLASKAMSNKPATFDNSYRQGLTPVEQNAISLSLQEREHNYVTGKIFELAKNKPANPVPNRITNDLGISIVTIQNEKNALENAPLKHFRTDVSGCNSLWFGELANKDGLGPCESGAKCFRCRSQLITEDTLWQTFSYYWACISKKEFMSDDLWSSTFKHVIEKCDNLIHHPNLDFDTIKFWKQESLKCPHPAWAFHLINYDTIALT
jgi:hypothetical protein